MTLFNLINLYTEKETPDNTRVMTVTIIVVKAMTEHAPACEAETLITVVSNPAAAFRQAGLYEIFLVKNMFHVCKNLTGKFC
jgi:hypothetical protein